MKATLAISLDTGLIVEIQRLAQASGRSVSGIVEDALKAHLEKLPRPRPRSGRKVTVTEQDQLEESEL